MPKKKPRKSRKRTREIREQSRATGMRYTEAMRQNDRTPEDASVTGAPGIGNDAPETVDPESMPTIDGSRRQALMLRWLPAVRYGVFDAFPDPRCDISRFTTEAFTRVLPTLPAETSDQDAFDAVMDVAMQLAADDQPRFTKLRGISHIRLFSLQDLYGYQLKEEDGEYRDLLSVIDSLPEREGVVFQMIAHCGWTRRETAQVLGISEAWTSKIMSRASASVREAVGAPMEELIDSFFGHDIARRKKK